MVDTVMGMTPDQLSGIGKGLSGFASMFDTPASSSTDRATIEMLPGLFGDTGAKGKEIGNFLLNQGMNRFGETIDPFVIPESTPGFNIEDFLPSSTFGGAYRDATINPTFGSGDPLEQAILSDLREQLGGFTASRELGMPGMTDAAVLNTLAPTLFDFQKDRRDALSKAFDTELRGALTGSELARAERADDLNALVASRGQNILGEQAIFDEGSNLLLALAGLSQPTPVVRQGASRSSAGGPSTASKIVSGIGTAASIASMFSDRRLKKNIINIKEYIKGINLYSFEYLWSPKKHIGFMADEVKKVIPSAVVQHESGFDKVDYSEVLRYAN